MAILDRLAMNALRVDIDGPSYRQHVADLRAKKKPAAKGDLPAKGDPAARDAPAAKRDVAAMAEHGLSEGT
jgi:hypothetical protein